MAARKKANRCARCTVAYEASATASADLICSYTHVRIAWNESTLLYRADKLKFGPVPAVINSSFHGGFLRIPPFLLSYL